jgi:hypothetical protein
MNIKKSHTAANLNYDTACVARSHQKNAVMLGATSKGGSRASSFEVFQTDSGLRASSTVDRRVLPAPRINIAAAGAGVPNGHLLQKNVCHTRGSHNGRQPGIFV